MSIIYNARIVAATNYAPLAQTIEHAFKENESAISAQEGHHIRRLINFLGYIDANPENVIMAKSVAKHYFFVPKDRGGIQVNIKALTYSGKGIIDTDKSPDYTGKGIKFVANSAIYGNKYFDSFTKPINEITEGFTEVNRFSYQNLADSDHHSLLEYWNALHAQNEGKQHIQNYILNNLELVIAELRHPKIRYCVDGALLNGYEDYLYRQTDGQFYFVPNFGSKGDAINTQPQTGQGTINNFYVTIEPESRHVKVKDSEKNLIMTLPVFVAVSKDSFANTYGILK